MVSADTTAHFVLIVETEATMTNRAALAGAQRESTTMAAMRVFGALVREAEDGCLRAASAGLRAEVTVAQRGETERSLCAASEHELERSRQDANGKTPLDL